MIDALPINGRLHPSTGHRAKCWQRRALAEARRLRPPLLFRYHRLGTALLSRAEAPCERAEH